MRNVPLLYVAAFACGIGIVGWLASLVMRTDGQQGILLNVVVGIVGAFLGGFLLAPMFGTGTINSGDLKQQAETQKKFEGTV